eukprot:PITA_30322
MKEELVYFGFVVSVDELKMDPEKIKTITKWPSPKSVFEVRSLHVLASFYRKFTRNFSKINASIIDTIKKDRQPFKWTAKVERNFQLLKRKITEKPILILLDFNKPFQVKCDASGEAIGGVLIQEDKPVAYFSEKLNDSKKKYFSYDKEFYAVVQSLKKWRHYLMSKEFILYSDNHALQYKGENANETTEDQEKQEIDRVKQLPTTKELQPERILDNKLLKKTRGQENFQYLVKWKDQRIVEAT